MDRFYWRAVCKLPGSLGEVDVVVYVVLAEAVVALALGAVSELQLRVRNVCPAADGALVAVAVDLLLVPGLVDGGAELGPAL